MLKEQMTKKYLESVEAIVYDLIDLINIGRYSKFESIDEIVDYIDGELYPSSLTYWYDEFLKDDDDKYNEMVVDISRELSNSEWCQEKIYNEIINEDVEKLLIEQ